jgi:hypothetical protein
VTVGSAAIRSTSTSAPLLAFVFVGLAFVSVGSSVEPCRSGLLTQPAAAAVPPIPGDYRTRRQVVRNMVLTGTLL